MFSVGTGRQWLRATRGMVAAFALLGAGNHPAHGLTFTVDSTGDGADADLVDGLCSAVGGQCTLRAAIDQANATMGQDAIQFAILPLDGAPKTIAPGGPLPPLSDTAGTVIDGFTQDDAAPNTAPDGMNAVLRIEIDGSGAGDVDGLVISGGSSTVRGLAINRFARNGIGMVTNGSNRVEGNFIGTDISGMSDRGNRIGVLVLANGNIIGGSTPAARNVIGANDSGVRIDGASANVVAGNFVGLAANGQSDLGNDAYGVLIAGANNTVGGATAAERNVISGNDLIGVVLLGLGSTGNLVQGNFIGTNAPGTSAVANQIGVDIEGPANTVGGLAIVPGDPPGNVIGGNDRAVRIPVAGATGNLIQGNLIGTNAAGSAPLMAGSGDGIEALSTGNVIGGAVEQARNVISGSGNGVRLRASGNTVQGNFIGTNRTGTSIVGNAGVGVEVTGSDNLIGGAATVAGAAPGNLIAANALGGVFLGAGMRNRVQGNAIGVLVDGVTPLGNGAHGVNIGSNGVQNTVGGAATGAGNAIAFNANHGVVAAFDPSSRDHLIEGNAIFSNGGDGVVVQLGGGIAIRRNAIFANGELGIDLVGGSSAATSPATIPATPTPARTSARTFLTSPRPCR